MIKMRVIVIAFLMIILVGCNNQNEVVLFDENDNYIGFGDPIEMYSMDYEEAVDQKYVMIEDLWIKENYDQIEIFKKISNDGKQRFLRFRHSLEGGYIIFYSILFYDDNGYYFYYQEEIDSKKESYKYLVEVEGVWMPGDYRRILVVTDDPNITMEQIHEARIAAEFDMETDIMRHRVVLVNYHELD